VVFSYPQSPRVFSIKRVIGLPGDRIELREKKLIVNGIESQYSAEDLHLEKQGFASQFRETIRFSEAEGDQHSHNIFWANDGVAENESKAYGPTIVPPNEVFLLGDHRDSSDDSRFWGTVPISSLHAQVWLVWLSLNWSDLHPVLSLPAVRTERIFLRPE
jgi:signal peptidase I